MFGYFGKGYVAPAPGAPPETAAGTAATEVNQNVQNEMEDEELPPSAVITPQMISSKAAVPTSQNSGIESRLAELRAEIAARKAAKDAELAALRAKQAKQAAYGRGETSTGTRSESEVAIGVSSGYYSGYLGDLTSEITNSADEVRKATDLVKALTLDVKTGSATSGELQRAMKDLNRKAARAAKLAKKTGQLKGYGEEKKSHMPLATLVVIGILAYFLIPRG